MRVSNNQFFDRAANDIVSKYADLNKIQQQISSGKRIINPSDDPAGSARVLGIDQQLSQTEQFQKNISFAKSRLNIAEGTLQGVTDMMKRMNELIIRGGGGSAGEGDRAAIALEVRESVKELVSLANSKDLNDQYIFAGNKAKQSPFTISGNTVSYRGDQSDRHVQVSQNKTIAVSESGTEVFMNIKDANGNRIDVFSVLDNFATNMENNVTDGNDLDNMNSILDHVLQKRSLAGARINTLESQERVNEDSVLDLKRIRTEINEVDIVSAIAKFQQENIALQSAQQSFSKMQGFSLFKYI